MCGLQVTGVQTCALPIFSVLLADQLDEHTLREFTNPMRAGMLNVRCSVRLFMAESG
jgi:hypothetical protein